MVYWCVAVLQDVFTSTHPTSDTNVTFWVSPVRGVDTLTTKSSTDELVFSCQDDTSWFTSSNGLSRSMVNSNGKVTPMGDDGDGAVMTTSDI